ncbi:uncharacterized protein LOC121390310 [Gigantopelta aegis]|uniref:uncharacterized protein LOC121390310 n=1 Tax=Gigantopelta aegis TaxID=1735272 RepID=UPI001B888C08|nr:uncharacterized protein LOC121390310 [Gigantopelta aegis]XP_041378029.1 uncharacterized protein LOC121390310 [Gigantopelta aegis]
MWLYLWGHSVYHLIRWFPRNNRTKIFFMVMLITAVLVVPQFFVLLLDHSSRWCRYPLLELLIVSLVFTLFLIGFTFLFMVMMPVPRVVKIIFHVFGALSLIISLVHIILTSKAAECSTTTEALYYLSFALAILSGISICYFALVLPFWMMNRLWKNSVLDFQNRSGICYEPVKCCSCVWHI